MNGIRIASGLLIVACCSVTPMNAQEYLTASQAVASFSIDDELQVTAFASEPEIVSISNIDVDHRGRVWACECVNYRGNNGKRPEGDRILILEDTDGDGKADETIVFYQGRDIDVPMGLCVLGNKCIVSVAPEILLLEDTDGDDRADKKTILLRSDAEYQHDHSLHSFMFGPDGRFYGNFGNTGRNLKYPDGQVIIDRMGQPIQDGGHPYWGGMVFRCDREFKHFEVLGHNFRNNYEAAVDSFGSVWQSDNDDDGNLAVRLNYILEGGNYGYLDEFTGQRWQVPRIGAHPHRAKRHWHQNDPGVVPNVIETGNGAPTGITVYEGRALPPVFHDQVIHCDAGPHVVWGLITQADGAGFTAQKHDIVRSPDHNFRPVDVAVAPDGSLFVSDWYDPVVGGFGQDDIERGRIYRISWKGHDGGAEPVNFDSPAAASRALRNPNACARYIAWTRLHQWGLAAVPALNEMLQQDNPRYRARAIWLLGQIPDRCEETIQRALNDSDPNVRVVGLRLADLASHHKLDVIEQLSNDPSPYVRAQCAVHLRHFQSPSAVRLWADLAKQHDGKDRWYLEALGIGADGKWDACFSALQGLQANDSVSPAAMDDIIWRSRAAETSDALAERIIEAPKDSDVRRYVRAFDFQSPQHRSAALRRVALSEHVSPQIALAAIQRIRPDDADSSIRQRLASLLQTAQLDSKSLDLINRYRLGHLSDRLLTVASDPGNPLGVDAMKTIMRLGDEKVLRRVESMFTQGKHSQSTSNLARIAVKLNDARLRPWLVELITDTATDLDTRRIVARELCASKDGALDVLNELQKQRVSVEVQQAVASALLTHRDQAIRQRAQALIPMSVAKDTKPLPSLGDLLQAHGDAQRGRAVFLGNGKCGTCHQVATLPQTTGHVVGPDLTDVGTKLTRSAIFEAILYPSAAISHGFETYAVVTVGGQVVTGLMVDADQHQVQLRDAEGNLRTLDREEIEKIQKQPISLMPADLHSAMTAQELVDVVAFVATLNSERDFVPMFDGKTLRGWVCAPLANSDDWWAEDGMLVGQSEGRGSYLAWIGGGEVRDFDVRLQYRIVSKVCNTGIQIRSKYFPNDWPYPLKGYQADIGHVGIGPKVLGGWDFHGQPRGDVLVQRGFRVVIGPDGTKTMTPIDGALTAADVRAHDWNDARVVAQGDTLTFSINGKVASQVVDREPAKRIDKGYLGLQLHSGPPSRVEFKNLRIKIQDTQPK